MWINPLFQADARNEVAQLLGAHSLVTLVAESPLRAAHLPLLLEDDGESMRLVGHIPRVDPVAQAIDAGERILCIVHGARAYVSAGWYDDPGLSTYNFSVVHLEGAATTMTDPAELRAHLVELVRVHEEAKPAVDAGPWQIDAVADARIDALLPAVMGFRITVDSAQAKTKFGQNRSHDDRVATREHLHRSPAAEDREIAERMDDAVDAPDPRRPGH
ncbi:FMN-binding negative transcriptional regulator [Microbacterium sp.]|uniref:FMN-binding negative transcriptional regulator n=1 Tax=Microbacterium sp. TaxID=51671 RepID=UPI003F9D9D3A